MGLGVVKGVTQTEFAPGKTVTREEFTVMLARLLGVENAGAESGMADVLPGAWYAAGVAGAIEAGLASGMGDGTFGIGQEITREQMAQMAFRAAKSLGVKLNENAPQPGFTDWDAVAGYAKPAVSALYEAGLVNGMGDKTFSPKGGATRAEAAKMLYSLWQAK